MGTIAMTAKRCYYPVLAVPIPFEFLCFSSWSTVKKKKKRKLARYQIFHTETETEQQLKVVAFSFEELYSEFFSFYLESKK